jgi:hypothetical protein
MIDSGGNVDIELAESILERKDEALPYLTSIARNDRYWRSEGVEGWAPINAIHLLAFIGGKEALDAVLYATYNHAEEMGDWLTEDLPSILAYFGPSAFEALVLALGESKLEPFARNSVGRALHSIVRKNENLRERTIVAFVNAITNEKDMLARTLLVDVLIEFKEREKTLPLVRELFKKDLLDRSALQPKEVEEVYAGAYDDTFHADDDDPMDLFRNDKSKWYSPPEQDVAGLETPRAAEPSGIIGPIHTPETRKKKPGRNEPCPCGSGKKYKKCCLIKDR